MRRLVQHVLEPVRAIGDLQRNPIGLVVFHASVPVGAEAENLAIEVIFGVAVIDEKAGVNHVARNGIGLSGSLVAFSALDELDAASFGIIQTESETVVGAAFDLAGLDSLLREVTAQRSNVVGGEGNVINAIGGLGVGGGAVSDPLLARHVADGLPRLDRIGRDETENVGVEVLHAVGRGRVEANVIDARNAGTSGLRLREGREWECGTE